MEFIAGDTRLVTLTELTDITDHFHHLIVFFHCLTDRFIGNIHSVVFMQRFQDMVRALNDRQIIVSRFVLKCDLHILMEELVIALSHGLQQFHILNTTVDHGASVRSNHTVSEIISAFNSTFQQGTAGLAKQVRHVVRSDIHGTGLRCRKPNREAFSKIQQRLRNIFARVGYCDPAFFLCLCNQLIVCLLKQIFKINQMFEIFQYSFPPSN